MPEFELNTYFEQTRRDPAFARLAERVQAGLRQPVNVYDLAEPQKAWLGMALAAAAGRRPCFLVPDELRARSLASDLRALTDRPVLVFRPRELNLTDAEAVSHEGEMQRLAILAAWQAGEDVALIVTAAAAIQKIMPQHHFAQSLLQIAVGDKS